MQSLAVIPGSLGFGVRSDRRMTNLGTAHFSALCITPVAKEILGQNSVLHFYWCAEHTWHKLKDQL